MPQFETATYPSQVFWLLVCFSILCVAMRLIVVPRLTKTLNTREQRLQEDWSQSKALLKEGEELKQKNLRRLAEARSKAHSMLHQVLHEIHHRKTERLASVEEELSIKTRNVRADLENQAQKILGNMEPLVSQVVKLTSSRILGQQMTQGEIKKVVSDVLSKTE